MKTHQRLLAGIACLLWPALAPAQPGRDCPTLPDGTGMAWQRVEGADFTFCKAVRSDDGVQVFSVMLAARSPFRPERGNRAENATVDGHATQWYRSEVAGKPALRVREAVVELDRDHVAHISVQAGSDQALAEALREVEALRFDGTLLSSN